MNELQQIIEQLNQTTDIKKLKQLWQQIYFWEKLYCDLKGPQKQVINIIDELESRSDFIIDQAPITNVHCLSDNEMKELSCQTLTENQLNQVLDTIIYRVRMQLVKNHQLDLTTSSLKNLCLEATAILCHKWARYYDVMQYQVQTTFHKNVGHYYVVGRFNTENGTKRYIIDPTYRQFCLISRCIPERLYHTYENYLSPGYFFRNQELLKQLLAKGYFEVTEETLTNYGEAFVLAGKSIENSKQKKFAIPTQTSYNYLNYNQTIETGLLLK